MTHHSIVGHIWLSVPLDNHGCEGAPPGRGGMGVGAVGAFGGVMEWGGCVLLMRYG
jgi:hypothetical protein